MKTPQTFHKDDETKAKAAAPVADKMDGTKEHVETIRYLMDQMRAEKQSDTTRAALDEITRRVDLLEGKPEAVEAEKAKFAQSQHDKAEKAKADAAQAKEDAKASA